MPTIEELLKKRLFYRVMVGLALTLLLANSLLSGLTSDKQTFQSIPDAFIVEEQIRFFLARQELVSRSLDESVKQVEQSEQSRQEGQDVEKLVEQLSSIQTDMQVQMQSASKELSRFLELHIENQIEAAEKILESSTDDKSLNELRREKLTRFVKQARLWYPVVITAVYPRRMPVLLNNLEITKDARHLMAAIISSRDPAILFPAAKKSGTATQAVQKKAKDYTLPVKKEKGKLVNRTMTADIPDAFSKAWLKLCADLPDTADSEQKEKLLAMLNSSLVSVWLQRQIGFDLNSYFDGRTEAEAASGFLKSQRNYAVANTVFQFLIATLAFIGIFWLFFFRARSSSRGLQMPVLFAPNWHDLVGRMSVFFVIVIFVQQVISLALLSASVRPGLIIFISYLLSFGAGFFTVFPHLFAGYHINLKKYVIDSDLLLSRRGPMGLVKWSFGSFVVSLAIISVVNYLVVLLGLAGQDSAISRQILDSVQNNSDLVLLFVSVCIFAPFFEELFFRGYLLSGLLRKLTRFQAILICGTIFGLVHADPNKVIHLSVLGMVLAYVRLQSGSIIVPMITHLLFNLQAFINIIIMKL